LKRVKIPISGTYQARRCWACVSWRTTFPAAADLISLHL